MLDGLRVRGLEQVLIHCTLAFMAMLAVALAAVQGQRSILMRMIKHFTA